MKKTVLLLSLFIFMGLTAFSQNKITVNGRAEKAIVPDQIYLTLTLQDQVEMGSIRSLEQQEATLIQLADNIGIAIQDMGLENISGYYDQYNAKMFLASKVYIIKVNGIDQLTKLIDQMNQLSATNVNISSYSHSKIDEYMVDLRKAAIADARKDAEEIAAEVGKKVGEVLEIEDLSSSAYSANPKMIRPYNTSYATTPSSSDQLDIKNIVLSYTVKMAFVLE